MKRCLLSAFFLLAALQMAAQYSLPNALPSFTSYPAPAADTSKVHSVKKATWQSVMLPGLGQAYNEKYWKIPIIYAGLATCTYFIIDNNKYYKRYKAALIAELDDDPNTGNDTGYNAEQLESLMNQYRTWLEWSYFSISAVYLLNILDAHVDAHLFNFDVGESARLQIAPQFSFATHTNIGGSLRLNF